MTQTWPQPVRGPTRVPTPFLLIFELQKLSEAISLKSVIPFQFPLESRPSSPRQPTPTPTPTPTLTLKPHADTRIEVASRDLLRRFPNVLRRRRGKKLVCALAVGKRSGLCRFPKHFRSLSLSPRMTMVNFNYQKMASALSFCGSALRQETFFLFTASSVHPKRRSSNLRPMLSLSSTTIQHIDKFSSSNNLELSLMVNGCTGKMGQTVINAADSAGLGLVPISFGSMHESGQIVKVAGKDILVHGPSDRENVLAYVFDKYPNLIVVDYTVPTSVNDNADLYCKVGVPFVMGTTGGDRDQLYKTVEGSNVYAVISPQMGKQVVAFLAAMEIMAEQFPGAFSGYSLQVMESHQASKLDTSGTAKAVVSCFQKLGVSFDMDQIKMIRDAKQQIEMVGVPEEHLSGHAFHMYHLVSPDQTVVFEFQHNVCGRSIYAEGTIDAAVFLAKKIQSKDEKRIYNMIDVLREGNMR